MGTHVNTCETPPTPPSNPPPCSPPAVAPDDCGCDEQGALIAIDIGTDDGLQIDADALGLNVADVSVDGIGSLLDGLLSDVLSL